MRFVENEICFCTNNLFHILYQWWGAGGVGLSKGGQKIQTFSYRVRKYWGVIIA